MTEPAAQPQPLVRLNKLVQASPQQVYDTWLDASLYPQWFVPDPTLGVFMESQHGMRKATGRLPGMEAIRSMQRS